MEIILDDSSTLEERFEKIDSRLVVGNYKTTKKIEKISPEIKNTSENRIYPNN